jgi:flagellar biogenesis protein FliO
MNCIVRSTALVLYMAWTYTTASAEPTAGPPAWNDKASVYLAMSQAAADDSEAAARPTASSNVAEAAPIVDSTVAQSAHTAPIESASTKSGGRYLAPPSAQFAPAGNDEPAGQGQPANAASRRLAEFGVPTQSIYTVLCALAIVIGAFLLFTWALKRGGRAASRRGALPADVVSVLGRVPLAARQFAELLRVGNKLVLVSLTPNGAETLTEVTDPAEVDRLVGLCQQSNPFSTTKAFEQVFQQMSAEPTPGGFLGNEAVMSSLASPVGAYRAHRGGALRG